MQSMPSPDALYSQYGCLVLQYVLPRTAVSTAPYCSMYCLVLQYVLPCTASVTAWYCQYGRLASKKEQGSMRVLLG